MKKLLIFLFISIGMLQYVNAQTVTGLVTGSDDGLPLPGVNIQVKGTSTGTVTDLDGKYTIEVTGDAPILIFSFIGYTSKEIAVNEQTSIDVQLDVEAKGIDEIVVVGYGTQKITKVSGAISTVKAADIEQEKPVRVEEVLQGHTSGVSVIQNGSPGSKPTVFIRGIPSYTGNDPVVIIDGVPQTLDDLNAINSSDIESVNILKDAASTAIYGVKGGNGVIVVTTKNGKNNQKTQFSVNSYFGQQELMHKIGMLNAAEYGAIINEGSVASGGDIIFPDLSKLGVGTDWQDQIFKKAFISSNDISASGGSEKISYFLSTGYLTQDGIVGGGDKSNFKRANFTANLSFDIAKNLKLIVNTNYVNIHSKGVQENSFNSIIGSALNFDPTVEVYNTVPNTVGKYGFSNLIVSEIFNPLTKLENTYNQTSGNKLFGKGELQYEIIEGLKLTSRYGYVKWDQTSKEFTPLVFYGPDNVENTMNADGSTVDGRHNKVTESQLSVFNFTFETFANYNFKINEAHNFETVLGFSISKSKGSGFDVSREDVPFNSWDFADITSATGTNSTENLTAQTGNTYQYLTRRNLSYFGRINYDYNGKYLASFSMRRDGSIAFGAENKFGNFYAGSLGWVVSEEDFFNLDFINHLKIRGSYGTTGNEKVEPQYVQIVTGGPSYNSTANSNGYTFGTLFVPGSTVNSFKNETLRWEKQIQFNAGFDITVLNNKISLSADYFDKRVDGLLFKDASPLYAGTSLPVDANIGSTKSSGFDLTLRYDDNLFDGLKLSTSFTFTTSNNLVTETNRDGTAIITGGNYFNGQSINITRFEKGYTPGYFYGWKTDGLFQTVEEIASSPKQTGAVPGDIKFVDISGPDGVPDGIIDDQDRTKIGDPFPDFTIGWNLGLEYKNIYIKAFTYASIGNDIYKAYDRNQQFSNKPRTILDRWTGPYSTNDAKNPRYSFTDANSNIRPSDRYVEDGSFAKIKYLTVGYIIPPALYKNKIFSKISIYAQVKNLYTFTKYSGFDPEIPGGTFDTGVDRGDYPQARTYAIGLDLKF